MSFAKALKCQDCGRRYPLEPLYTCEYCFGALEVEYDYEAMRGAVSKEAFEKGPPSLWRYLPVLPVEKPGAGFLTGFTPLVRARNLERELGVRELYIKDDTVNHPTLSFKDRVVAVALTKAKEFGFDTVACVSTGNLANALSGQAAVAGLRRFIFIPATLETAKIVGSLIYDPHLVLVDGTFDQINRLCAEITERYNWAFVNVNLRPYYAEGSKTMAYEIAEGLGWRLPGHVVAPAASGLLITQLDKGFRELNFLGLVEERREVKIYIAQPEGCAPIAEAVRKGTDFITPVREPKTIAKSLAIGSPFSGVYAARVVMRSGGYAAVVSDKEIVEAIKLLARTEGIFAETAGGVTLAGAIKLIEEGRIPRDEPIVVCITGNGYKTQDAVVPALKTKPPIKPTLEDFERYLKEVGEG